MMKTTTLIQVVLVSPAQVVQLFKNNGLTKMRLFDPDIAVLESHRHTNIDLILGIQNEDLPAMSASTNAVNSWFTTYIQPYLNDIIFHYIVVGNEVVPGNLDN
ncbi:hypothetical protein K1719_016629 [Acacia pycnantha]|nr:hypothetical protein K1719_016629 [Acacia pycnantha]